MRTHAMSMRIRYADIDRMGVVHHSRYAVWFEEARTEMLKSLGYTYAQVEGEGVLLPLIDLWCGYKKPVRYGDDICIETAVEKLSCVRLSFRYAVYKMPGRELAAAGRTDHAWTDSRLVPVNALKRIPDIYAAIQAFMQGGEKAET